MSDEENQVAAGKDQVVEPKQRYTHKVHGEVEVTGIWRGVENVDEARYTDGRDMIIVRYAAVDGGTNGELDNELTDTLSDFLELIK